ncbi:unnamed protein product [Kuraishia capsulata CBS 1993]|uniref:Uncharacterized protein n=1 Tax=Kuraishia capsulata CBS 1993 TaxID=1382522 RepID=W6MMZ1_9ASCO|nr:uncharacterized protein KUCA_T00003941001 [Kuraishia capsulata CBS 1993]CDK27961.1 unnamed protein product [Kuraishia capsulata CBS 1993]
MYPAKPVVSSTVTYRLFQLYNFTTLQFHPHPVTLRDIQPIQYTRDELLYSSLHLAAIIFIPQSLKHSQNFRTCRQIPAFGILRVQIKTASECVDPFQTLGLAAKKLTFAKQSIQFALCFSLFLEPTLRYIPRARFVANCKTHKPLSTNHHTLLFWFVRFPVLLLKSTTSQQTP